MLRPANATCLRSLRRAASATDAELDLALLRLGVLAPADLQAIRECLSWQSTTLEPLENRDGHRVIGIYVDGHPAAWIHHDGRVAIASDQRLLLGV